MPTHAERRVLPYSQQQLYDLVADVERYPEFLPWCVGTRIRERRDNLIVADVMVGFRMFRERFTSRVTLLPEDPEGPRIDAAYADGPFKYLTNHWIFHSHPVGCEIDFYVDFEFRSRLLQKAIEMLFNEAVKRMVHSFEQRAHEMYGRKSAPMQKA